MADESDGPRRILTLGDWKSELPGVSFSQFSQCVTSEAVEQDSSPRAAVRHRHASLEVRVSTRPGVKVEAEQRGLRAQRLIRLGGTTGGVPAYRRARSRSDGESEFHNSLIGSSNYTDSRAVGFDLSGDTISHGDDEDSVTTNEVNDSMVVNRTKSSNEYDGFCGTPEQRFEPQYKKNHRNMRDLINSEEAEFDSEEEEEERLRYLNGPRHSAEESLTHLDFLETDVISKREREWRSELYSLLCSTEGTQISDLSLLSQHPNCSQSELHRRRVLDRYEAARLRWERASRALDSPLDMGLSWQTEWEGDGDVTSRGGEAPTGHYPTCYRPPIKRDWVAEGAKMRSVWESDRFLKNYNARKLDIPRYHEHLRRNFDPFFKVPVVHTHSKRVSSTLKQPGVSFRQTDIGSRFNKPQ